MQTPDDLVAELLVLDCERAHRQRVEAICRRSAEDQAARTMLALIAATVAARKCSIEYATAVVVQESREVFAYLGADLPPEVKSEGALEG